MKSPTAALIERMIGVAILIARSYSDSATVLSSNRNLCKLEPNPVDERIRIKTDAMQI